MPPTLREMIDAIAAPPRQTTVLCHPENLHALLATFKAIDEVHARPFASLGLPHAGPPFGMPVRTSEHLPRRVRRWEFPETPFVEYERPDEEWAIPLGLGRWVETDEPYFMVISDPTLPQFTLRYPRITAAD